MFHHLTKLVARDSDGPPSPPLPHTMMTLIVVLLILLIFTALLLSILLFMRQRRRARKSSLLPIYDKKRLSISSASSSHRRVMVRPSESVHVHQEKQILFDDANSPPPSPIPEIRITFPEEIDASGKRKSGRVVVVRVGDSNVGLEPINGLPVYQQGDGERFQSIDLERVGGLVEKARNAPRSPQ